MAKDNTFYFSHDYNAMSDEKIKNLLCEHGLAGYGAFWALIEMLYNNANALRTHYKSIAFALHSDELFIKSVINDFDLFIIDGDFFGSESVERRLNERKQKSKSASISASYRWKEKNKNANASKINANASKNDAIKERKVKESKEEDIHEKTKFDIFNDWLKEKYPNVSKMNKQMTESNLNTLIDKYGREKVYDIFMQMENKKGLTRLYDSVYLTANNWIKRQK